MSAATAEIGESIVANGIRTNYLVAGEGPPVILIHGSGPGVTAYANWRLILPRLAPHFRCYALDVVGFGYTDRPAGFVYDMDGWVSHLLGFMDALGVEQADFIGNSFGGALTLALATRHPARARRFVLMGSGGVEFELTDGLDLVWGYEPSVENMARVMDYFAYNRSLITPALVESRYQASIRPGYQETYGALFPAPRQRHISAIATPEEAIRALAHQALIVHGRDDRVVPYETSLKLHQLIRRSQLHSFGECGHWTQVEKSAEFSQLVLDFLRAQ